MKYIQNRSVHAKKIKDKWYLLEKNKEHIRELNEVAGFIWSVIKTPQTFQVIVDRVTQEYDVDLKNAQKDIKKFLEDYIHEGFVLRS